MSNERQIYLLDPQDYPPETIAVAFAKTSRSPESFRQIASELNDEKSKQFHERWVVGYGHASVAEHAVLHLAVENVSRLAVECLESNRLASYTEKSTRYQQWKRENFHTPEELAGHPLLPDFNDTLDLLFETYASAIEPVQQAVAHRCPPREGESDRAYARRTRSDAIDVCRFLLPSAALANVGVTVNARTLEHALRKMYSSPLAEVRAMGAEMRAVAEARLPTLIRYVDRVPYHQEAAERLTLAANSIPRTDGDWCQVEALEGGGEIEVLAAAIYRHGGGSFADALAYVRSLDAVQQRRLAEQTMGGRGRHDMPLRELEYAQYRSDLVVDQGGYFELKRHRMLTMTAQRLTADLGYAIPRRISEAGLEEAYRGAMESAARTWRRLAEVMPEQAAYIVPNGFNRRVLMGFNLRSAYHLCSLRSALNAHFSMRRVAQRLAEELRGRLPITGDFLLSESSETWQQVEMENFTALGVQPRG